MKFKRQEIIDKLRAERERIIAEVEARNAEWAKKYEDAQRVWFEDNEDRLRNLLTIIQMVIDKRRPLQPEEVGDVYGRVDVGRLACKPPEPEVANTTEIDAGIALLEAALDQHITLVEMEKAGVYVRRWALSRG